MSKWRKEPQNPVWEGRPAEVELVVQRWPCSLLSVGSDGKAESSGCTHQHSMAE